MAGANTTKYITVQVNDVLGVIPDLFVEPIANATATATACRRPVSANVRCLGINAETIANGLWTAVAAQQSDIQWVIGDGTCAVGDQVTNDADGKATPISASGTPINYHIHGIVMEQNTDGSGNQLVKIELRFYVIKI